eukprot:CAMPEP_0172402436 /NCGR_PEP_ID=MMETSP1061-20121228/54445_1 /TAXON_ID=37318 /ORGANISM="Pseudo-nitzschia pungens, Strain cf. pungens" /LENGTH=115 /DNA_ID=CAMNT_0013136413 /DNA_START=102 /DNA_END=446 /DNA_ORIENTATION=+
MKPIDSRVMILAASESWILPFLELDLELDARYCFLCRTTHSATSIGTPRFDRSSRAILVFPVGTWQSPRAALYFMRYSIMALSSGLSLLCSSPTKSESEFKSEFKSGTEFRSEFL